MVLIISPRRWGKQHLRLFGPKSVCAGFLCVCVFFCPLLREMCASCAIPGLESGVNLATRRVKAAGPSCLMLPNMRQQRVRQGKKHKDDFLGVQRSPGGVGVFHAKGWWPKSSCPPSKVCLPWASKREESGMSREFCRMSRTPGGVLCAKKFRVHFSFSKRPNPKKGAPDTQDPSCIGFTVLRGRLRPWSQTMVSEGARPWGKGRSEFADHAGWCKQVAWC